MCHELLRFPFFTCLFCSVLLFAESPEDVVDEIISSGELQEILAAEKAAPSVAGSALKIGVSDGECRSLA